MRSAIQSAICTTAAVALSFSLRSLNPTARRSPLVLLWRPVVFPAKLAPFASMANGESGSGAPASPSSHSVEKQFEEFRHQLNDSGALRERIRNFASEIESATSMMQSNLLLIHQSRPVPGAICELCVLYVCNLFVFALLRCLSSEGLFSFWNIEF